MPILTPASIEVLTPVFTPSPMTVPNLRRPVLIGSLWANVRLLSIVMLFRPMVARGAHQSLVGGLR